MSTILEKIKIFPESPGVYIFKDKKGEVIYVGKATSLRDRVGSYFQSRAGYARPIEFFIAEVVDIEIIKIETVLEAYILEQSLIKRFLPKYNVSGKDDKSFCYVLFTKEEFPRLEIKRKTDLLAEKCQGQEVCINKNINLPAEKLIDKKLYSHIYGPYLAKHIIERALKILRRIFPYHSRREKTEKGCLDYQLGVCPGPFDGAITEEDYQKNIRGIRMILEGKKNSLIRKMQKEMEKYAKENEFEKAAKVRNQLFALRHIQDVALISENRNSKKEKPDKIRIEGYDISNISGKNSVGSMVVFDNIHGEIQPNKSEYRKFKIKTIAGANDVGMMEEVLRRRFRNNWPLPNLILLDGGKGHLNMARRVLRIYHLDIPLLSIAKGPTRKKLDRHSFGSVPEIEEKIIEQIRDEAHRFAIGYHRKLRAAQFSDGQE